MPKTRLSKRLEKSDKKEMFARYAEAEKEEPLKTVLYPQDEEPMEELPEEAPDCKEVEQFIADNYQGRVDITNEVSYNMRDVNAESFRIFNGMFQNGKEEPTGFIRAYYRKAWVVYRTLVQGSDLDLKNLNIRSLNGVRVRLVALLKMAFSSHLSREMFGETIDTIMGEMCWFGTSIVKRFDGQVGTVDLRNYITENNIQNPQERRHLEYTSYTYDRILSYKDKMSVSAWNAVVANFKALQQAGQSQFRVLEFWTWEVREGKARKVCVKYLDNTITDQGQYENPTEWVPYIELDRFVTPYKKKRMSTRMRRELGDFEDMFPYEQFDLFKIFGRMQAMGIGELLADVQIVYNTVFNSQVKGMMKAQMGVHVHNAIAGTAGLSELLQENIANLLEGGVVSLAPGESINNLPMDTKLQDFDILESKIYELMRQLVGVTAAGTGEEMPASTSATQASINQANANTVFDFTRERMHHGMKRLFNNGFAEDVWDEIDEKELTAIVGNPIELQEMDEYFVKNSANLWALEMKSQTGMYPTEEEYQNVIDSLKTELAAQGDMRFVQIKKMVRDNMDTMVEFNMTSEAIDTKSRFDALMALKADPLSTKSKAKIEDEILTLQDLNPRQFDKSVIEKREEAAQREAAQQAELAKAGHANEAMIPPPPVQM